MVITCGIWLVNNRSEILFAHPTYHSKDFHTIPKGIMDEGESEFEAAKREMYEETNISWDQIEPYVTNITELELKKFKNRNKYLKSFVVQCDSDLEFLDLKCNSLVDNDKWDHTFPEVDGYIWKTLDSIGEDFTLHHSHLMCLDEVKEILG